MVTLAPLLCVAAVVPLKPRIKVSVAAEAPAKPLQLACVHHAVSESIWSGNSPEAGNGEVGVLIAAVAAVVLAIDPLSVAAPSKAGFRSEL
jgi:hypothetical protein